MQDTIETPADWRPLMRRPSFLLTTGSCAVLAAGMLLFAHHATGILSWRSAGPALFAIYVAFPIAVDLRTKTLPNRFTLPAAAGALAWSGALAIADASWTPLLAAMAGAGAAYGAWWVLSALMGVGYGDVKFAVAGGALLATYGPQTYFMGMVSLVGVFIVATLIVALFAGTRLRQRIPFGQNIGLAALTGLALPSMYTWLQ